MATPSVLLPEPVRARGAANEPEIIVRPMLTTAQKNFKDVGHCDSVLSQATPQEITRQDLNVPGSRCFLLHGLLTPEECRHYISETEKIGYSDLSDLFPAVYRSNDRVLAICEPLVECLWRRIEPFLTRKEVIRVRPIGFGNEGTWKPFRLNECCKFGRYRPGGHFSPHIDGPWVPHEDESSVFTVVVYLNSDFQGGETNFLDENDVGDVVCSVLPRVGTALIFNHDTFHEGQPVTTGTKYIIRTEIMFRRVDREMIPDPMVYESDQNYIKTLALYQKSWQLEQAGDVQGFTDTYLQAIQLQREAQSSIGTDTNELFEQVVPYELYMKIFGYLTTREVCNIMTVCKAWYDMAMDGQLWYQLYRRHWPIGIKLEAQLDHTKKSLKQEPGPFTKDWYGLYKQRVLSDSPKKVVVLDLGSFSCKCAAIHRPNCTVKTSCTESVVALAPGVFDLHMRRGEYDRYFCGKRARENYPEYLVNVIEKGVPVQPHLLPEIVTGFYYDCHVRPKYCPVIILEPPGLWDVNVRGKVAYSFLEMFLQPSVSFLSSAVAVLCGMDLTSGVVLDIGYGIVTCAAVWRGEECPHPLSCDPDEATPTKLADMVHTVISGCGKGKNVEMQNALRSSVVITGGKADNVDKIRRALLSKDPKYMVHEPGDKVYAAVSGGSALAALSIFKIFQVSNSFQPRQKHDGHQFYKICLQPNYWLFGLSTRAELEEFFGGSLRDIFSDQSFFVDSDEDENIKHVYESGSENDSESENDEATVLKDGNEAVASSADRASVGNEASGAVGDSSSATAVSGTQPSQPANVEEPTGAKVGTDGLSRLAPEAVCQHSSENESTELALMSNGTHVTEAHRLKDSDATRVGKSEKASEPPAQSTTADQQVPDDNSDEFFSPDLNTITEIGVQQEPENLTNPDNASKPQEGDQEQPRLAALMDPQSVPSTAHSENLQPKDPPNTYPQNYGTGEVGGASVKTRPLASDSLVDPKSGIGKKSRFCAVV